MSASVAERRMAESLVAELHLTLLALEREERAPRGRADSHEEPQPAQERLARSRGPRPAPTPAR
jgi:hypothetical protein